MVLLLLLLDEFKATLDENELAGGLWRVVHGARRPFFEKQIHFAIFYQINECSKSLRVSQSPRASPRHASIRKLQ